MTTTYTANTGIEKPGTGEQSGVWGTTVNTNSDILDRAINGVLTLGLSGTSSTLTTTDGTLSNGQYKLLVLSGAPSGTHTITVGPNNAQKIYFIYNTTAQSVIFSQGAGADVTILTNESNIIYCDGGGAAAAVFNLSENFNVALNLKATNNLSDLANAPTALVNLGVTATAAQLDYNVVATLGASENSKTVTADANGDVSLSQELIAKSYNETYLQVFDAAGTTTIDCELGNTFMSTLTVATQIAFTSPPGTGTGYTMSVEIIQDSSGSGYSVSWPVSVDWPSATAPVISTAANSVDIFVFTTRDGGITWYGFTAGQALG
tara:strand:+ start:3806 stop:4765 length:960 start_codon:yes stop_codon:yes gene_type:complete